MPGNIGTISSDIELSGEYNIIKIFGSKNKDKEPEKDDNIFNTREYGNFYFEIPLKTKEYLLGKDITMKNGKGVYILEFTLLEKDKPKSFDTNEGDI